MRSYTQFTIHVNLEIDHRTQVYGRDDGAFVEDSKVLQLEN